MRKRLKKKLRKKYTKAVFTRVNGFFMEMLRNGDTVFKAPTQRMAIKTIYKYGRRPLRCMCIECETKRGESLLCQIKASAPISAPLKTL